jgi:hypothetical protein
MALQSRHGAEYRGECTNLHVFAYGLFWKRAGKKPLETDKKG